MPNNTVDELYLLNKDEKPLSTKIAATVGGITSFGAILPIFLSNFSKVFGGSSAFAFKVLIGLYFLLPIVVLAVWLSLARLPQSRDGMASSKSDKGDTTHASIYRALIWLLVSLGLQFALGLIMILAQRAQINDNQRYAWIIIYALMQVGLGYLLWLFVYEKNIDAQPRRLTYSISLLVLLGVAISIAVPLAFAPKPGRETKASRGERSDYRYLQGISTLNDQVSSIEKETRRRIERYRLKSHMAWTAQNVNSADAKALKNVTDSPYCYRHYLIHPYLYFMNALILANKDSISKADSIAFRGFLASRGLDTSVAYDNATFFNAYVMYAGYVKVRQDSDVIAAYVPLFDSTLFQTLDSKSQRIPISVIMGDGQLRALLQHTGLLKPNISIDSLTALKFTIFLDEVNSIKLNEWIQDFLAFIQRKAQKESNETSKRVEWIFQDAQVEGLLIFGTLIITLLIYYILLLSEASSRRKTSIEKAVKLAEDKNLADSTSESPDKIKSQLEFSLKLVDFYVFPALTFLGIIVPLIIPLCKPIKAENIQLSQPDWFLSVPNWNVTAATADVIRASSGTSTTGGTGKDEDENGGGAAGSKAPGSTTTIINQSPALVTGQLATKKDVEDARDNINYHTDSVRSGVLTVSSYLNKK